MMILTVLITTIRIKHSIKGGKGMINKKVKFLSLFFVIFLLVSSLTGCARKLTIHADYPYYSNINDLTNSANIVISGKVKNVNKGNKLYIDKGPEDKNIDSNKKDNEGMIYTVSEIEVTDVIKGNLKVGDKIKVKQLGGTYDNVTYKVDDMTYLQKGKEYVLFLQTYEDIDPNEPYCLLNPVQAYMDIDNDKVKPSPKNNLFKSEYTKDEFKKVLKSETK